MKARGLAWVGARTHTFDDTVRFVGMILGLRMEHEVPDFAVFRLPNGDKVEIFGPGERDHEHFTTGPVVGFLVDDVTVAREDLEEAGISFISPVHEVDDGGSWSHFTGPDGKRLRDHRVSAMTTQSLGEDNDKHDYGSIR